MPFVYNLKVEPNKGVQVASIEQVIRLYGSSCYDIIQELNKRTITSFENSPPEEVTTFQLSLEAVFLEQKNVNDDDQNMKCGLKKVSSANNSSNISTHFCYEKEFISNEVVLTECSTTARKLGGAMRHAVCQLLKFQLKNPGYTLCYAHGLSLSIVQVMKSNNQGKDD